MKPLHQPVMKANNEKRIEAYLVERIAAKGGWALKMPSLFIAGLPDRLVLLPKGLSVFVETKSEGQKARTIQKARHSRLRTLGFRVEVLDSIEAVNQFISSL